MAKPAPAQDAKGRFVTGNIGGGRHPSSRNKLGEAFIEALSNDFEVNGVAVIETVRTEDPTQYLKVIAAVIPKEIVHTVEEYDQLSDDQLEQQFIAEATRLATARRARSGKGAQGESAQVLN